MAGSAYYEPDIPAAAGGILEKVVNPVARITIDLNRPVGIISPHIYGHFTEHIGGVIYDGIWVGEDSVIPNIGGIRSDLVEHLRRIRPPVIRWPGGCFADRYHWQDGIGPREKRPRRYGRWNDVTEPNLFGTHEFIHFCRLVDAVPYFAANVGTGSPEEFQQWIEYCNAPAGSTTLADMRAENGSQEPLGVRFWGVGNELWGCGGNFTPEDYADHYRRFTTWLPKYGVPLYSIACGPSGDDREWSRRFFQQYRRAHPTGIDGWSVHYYCGSAGGAVDFSEADWYELLRKGCRMEDIIRGQWEVVAEFDPEHKMKLIIDEWGAWHPPGTEINPRHTYEQMSTMRDALIAALTLDIFNRHADKVFMANIAQMVNNLHSLFLADEDRFVATPNFHVFEMYAPHQGAQAIQTEWDVPNVEGLPALIGSASLKDKCLVLTATNLHATEPMEAEIRLSGARIREARQTVLSHTDIHAHNTFQRPAEVMPVASEVSLRGDTPVFTFPPASVVRLDLSCSSVT